MVTLNDAFSECSNNKTNTTMLFKPTSDDEKSFFKNYFQNDEYWEENDKNLTELDKNKNAICLYYVSGWVEICLFRQFKFIFRFLYHS